MSWQNDSDYWKDNKIAERSRNILTLEERIKAIQAYDKKPIYQKVANIFQCSSKQIKNIIANRESIMMYYESCMSNGNSNEAKRIRHEKIVFLGKVMYEFLLRAQEVYQSSTPLTVQTIRSKALEIRDTIKIANFYPNTAWVNNFKSEYGITDFEAQVFDTDNARNNTPPSLDVNDLILYVSNRDTPSFGINLKPKQYENKMKPFQNDIGNINSFDYAPAVSFGNQSIFSGRQNFDYNSLYNDVVSLDSDNEDEDDGNSSPFYNQVHNMTPSNLEEESSDVRISDYNEALQYLKPLENFVLLQENYRAIGIISQLEKIFKFVATENQSQNN